MDTTTDGNSFTPEYYEHAEPWPRTPQGAELGYYIPLVYFIFPLVVIFNLILFIKIVTTEKIRGQPRRWLIANTCLCMIVNAVLRWNSSMTTLYLVPSLMSKPSCYIFELVNLVTWFMIIVSFTLVVIERFHTLVRRRSFNKKQVILCLVLFWLILTGGLVVPPVLISYLQGTSAFVDLPDGRCFVQNTIEDYTLLIIWIWALPTFIVVFIGTLVFKSRETTTESMNRSIVNPTLTLTCIGFFFMVLPNTLHVCFSIFPNIIDYVGYKIFYLTGIVFEVNNIVFPVVWLVTWSRNDDISLKCCIGEHS